MLKWKLFLTLNYDDKPMYLLIFKGIENMYLHKYVTMFLQHHVAYI